MPESQGQHSYGVQLFMAVLDHAPPAVEADLSGWTNIGEVISLNGVPMSVTITQLTHLASPNKAKEKIAGFTDGGQLSAKMNMSAAQYALLNARRQGTGSGRANSNFMGFVLFPDWGGSYLELILQQMPFDVPDDDRITIDVTFEISGLPAVVIF